MLNLPRLRALGAVNGMRGVRFDRGGQLPLEVFDVLSMSEEEARKRQEEYNVKAAVREAMDAAKRGY